MMGEIYDVQSAVEHLHENRYMESFDRETRLDLLKKEALAEHIARSALGRIVNDSNLWPHFANTSSLREFWALGRPSGGRFGAIQSTQWTLSQTSIQSIFMTAIWARAEDHLQSRAANFGKSGTPLEFGENFQYIISASTEKTDISEAVILSVDLNAMRLRFDVPLYI